MDVVNGTIQRLSRRMRLGLAWVLWAWLGALVCSEPAWSQSPALSERGARRVAKGGWAEGTARSSSTHTARNRVPRADLRSVSADRAATEVERTRQDGMRAELASWEAAVERNAAPTDVVRTGGQMPLSGGDLVFEEQPVMEGEFVGGGCASGPCVSGACGSASCGGGMGGGFCGREEPAGWGAQGDWCTDCGDCGEGCAPGGFGLCGGCWWENLTLFAGPQGFKGPVDQGRNGNFGFHEGFNWGGALFPAWQWGWQAGGQVVHSNLSGDQVVGADTKSRTQGFVTGGVFRRCRWGGPYGGGVQWGVVGDYLVDDYYVDMNFGQVRAEVSIIGHACHEFGFWTAVAGGDHRATYLVNNERRILEHWAANEQYLFFYRYNYCHGGQLRVWGGFTGEGDGLFGGDWRVPLSHVCGLEGNFHYVIPHDTDVTPGYLQESWNLGMNLVFYPGASARGSSCSPWRPLFAVADNTAFTLRRLADSGSVAP